MTMSIFGETIRDQRSREGVSLRALAERLGVTTVYLGEVERGVVPSLPRKYWDLLSDFIPSLTMQMLEELESKAADG